MGKFWLFAALLWLPVEVLAQSLSKPIQRLQLSGAVAFPVGDFRSRSFAADMPAFGRDGCLLMGSYVIEVHRQISLGTSLGWRANDFHRRKFLLPHDELVNSIAYSSWQSFVTLADVYWHSSNPEAQAYLKGSVGAAFNRSAFLWVATDFGDVLRTTDRATSVVFGLAAGIRHEWDAFGIFLETGYLYTRPTFAVSDAQGLTTTYRQGMSSLQVTLGGSFRF